ncbi:glycosyl hydrolase family 28-related protein [Cohnella zeiphila]|uniref:Rhamnogalacturonase A/B/Epimerase-like pectate lyase domain-containing protein n=1 Tax=Cohnella zeiphila TaxID=2761120 RepID=A0A7X0SSG3_9BACL|nr:glycosyl hydrolase family 28-related protein [Cohnella zeiphila]MBB6733053.1 hypothetical protein [Cohnella zeiphila]
MATSLNVQTAGAKGDGKTNDTAALQKAFASAAASGVAVFIPAGTYLINATLTTTVSILADPGAVLKANANFEGAMVAINASNLIVEKLKLNGNGKTNNGFRIATGNNHVTIRDCEVYGLIQLKGFTSETVGIRIQSNVHHVLIDGCYLHNLNAPVNGICRGVLANASGGGGDSTNLTIVNSRFEEIAPVDNGDGIVVQDYTGNVSLVIANNYFYRCYKRSIKVQVDGFSVIGNIIDSPFLGTAKKDVQPYSAISAYGSNGVIASNTCLIATALNPIELGISGTTTSNVSIIGNVVRQNKTTADLSNADCIRIYGQADHTIIKGNNLKDGRMGIHLNTNGNGLIISENTIDNVDSIAVYIDDNFAGAYPDNVSIVGNAFTNCNNIGIAAKSAGGLNGKHIACAGNVGTTKGQLIDAGLLRYVSAAANAGNA